VAAGLPLPDFGSDPQGMVTLVQAVHIEDLRSKVTVLEQQ